MGKTRTGNIAVNIAVSTSTDCTISGLLKGTGTKVAQAVAGTDYVAPSDSRLTDARTPADTSVAYAKVAAGLKSKATVASSIDLSAAGIGVVTLSTNTAFAFSGFELNKSYLLIITTNGYITSWAAAAKHISVVGNQAFTTTDVFYVVLTCIDATNGSEKLLTTIMKGG